MIIMSLRNSLSDQLCVASMAANIKFCLSLIQTVFSGMRSAHDPLQLWYGTICAAGCRTAGQTSGAQSVLLQAAVRYTSVRRSRQVCQRRAAVFRCEKFDALFSAKLAYPKSIYKKNIEICIES